MNLSDDHTSLVETSTNTVNVDVDDTNTTTTAITTQVQLIETTTELPLNDNITRMISVNETNHESVTDAYGNATTTDTDVLNSTTGLDHFGLNRTESDYVVYEPFNYRASLGNVNLAMLILGCVGNILSIIVLTRPKHRKSSTATYLIALAVSDSIILVNTSGSAWIYQAWDIHVRNLGSVWCKLSTFLTYSSVSTSSWLLIAVTIERVISVTFPYKIKTTCTPKLARYAVIAIWLAIYGINCHFLFGLGNTYYSADDVYCYALTDEYRLFNEKIVPWIDFTLVFAIPYIFIFFGNIIIIVQLTRSLLKRRQLTTSNKKADTSLTVTLVIVNVSFMATISPLTLFYAVFPQHDLNDPVKKFYLVFINESLNTLSNLNAAINFFLYFLSGAKFRSEVKDLLCSCSIFRHRQTAGGTPVSRGMFVVFNTANRIETTKATIGNDHVSDTNGK